MKARPRKVLYVDYYTTIAGGQMVLLNTFQALDRNRYQPVLALPGEGPFADEARRRGVPVFRVAMKKARWRRPWQAVPAALKTSALALIAGLQALASILVQPAAGAASDRLATPWGRRRPLMVEQRDNVWLLVSRLAILMATGTLQPFKRQGGPARRGCALPDATGDRNAAPARRLPHRPGQGLWSTVIWSFEVQPSAALSIVWSIQRADPFWSVTGKP